MKVIVQLDKADRASVVATLSDEKGEILSHVVKPGGTCEFNIFDTSTERVSVAPNEQ